MDSISKCRKHFLKMRVEGNEDRISNLPKCLISRILSFLPIRNAVATSVLSTKWRYLWTSITTLDFNDEVFVLPNPRNTNKKKQGFVKVSFIDFVDHVFMFNKVSDLQKFSLRCTRSYDKTYVWIKIALSRNLRELHLSDISSMPCELFTCASLVVLKLDGIFVLKVPTLVCLPSLKILVLDSVLFLDDDSIYRLFSSCLVLEDLSINNYDRRNISVFNISASSLKSLTINCQTLNDGSAWFDDDICNYSYRKCKIVLNTPNLRDLKYKDHVAEGYSLNKLNALVKVDVSFVERDFPGRDRSMEKLVIEEFVGKISKAEWLHLSKDSIKTFQLCRFSVPKFDRLTYLELAVDGYVEWNLLLDFVENSSRLETLIFGGLPRDYRQKNQTTSCWYQPRNVPSCLLFHLKKIEIKLFKGESNDLKMVEYFLKNSRFLEKLMIHHYWGAELEICKKVLMLPRGSQTCRVEVF